MDKKGYQMDKAQIGTTLLVVAIILVAYLNIYFQNKRQQKKIKEMQASIKEGDHIITYTGLSRNCRRSFGGQVDS